MFSFLLFIILAVIILAISVLRFVLRGLFPWLLFGRRNRAGQEPESGRRRNDTRKEGEVSIDYMPPRQDMRDARPGHTGGSADYVEYEEIKDDTKA